MRRSGQFGIPQSFSRRSCPLLAHPVGAQRPDAPPSLTQGIRRRSRPSPSRTPAGRGPALPKYSMHASRGRECRTTNERAGAAMCGRCDARIPTCTYLNSRAAGVQAGCLHHKAATDPSARMPMPRPRRPGCDHLPLQTRSYAFPGATGEGARVREGGRGSGVGRPSCPDASPNHTPRAPCQKSTGTPFAGPAGLAARRVRSRPRVEPTDVPRGGATSLPMRSRNKKGPAKVYLDRAKRRRRPTFPLGSIIGDPGLTAVFGMGTGVSQGP